MHLSGYNVLHITGTNNNKTKNVVMKRTFIAGALGLKRTDPVYSTAVTNFMLTWLRLLRPILFYGILHVKSWKSNIYVTRVQMWHIVTGMHYVKKCVCNNCGIPGIVIHQTDCPTQACAIPPRDVT